MTDLTPQGIRLEDGVELRSSIENTARSLALAFCDVTGFGDLQWVDLAGGRDHRTRRYQGPFHLTDLKGRIRIAGDLLLSDLYCTVSRNTDNGIEVLGGRLVAAEVHFVELTFSPVEAPNMSGIRAVEKPEKATVPKLVSDSSRPRPIDPPPGNPESEHRWSEAIAESERIEQEAAHNLDSWGDTRETIPNQGDIVNHLQFGRCTVVQVGDDHITLRNPQRRNLRLGLSVLAFIPEGEEDGKTTFRVQVKPK